MSTDFFDDDLARVPARDDREPDREDEMPDATASRMARQKEELSQQVAGTVQEIEALRMKQEALEKEKQTLEQLRRRQDEYESGKADMTEKLARGIVLLEKELNHTARMAQLLEATRASFQDTLDGIRKLDEESWAEEEFELELTRARAVVEEAQTTYARAISRVEAADWQKAKADPGPPGTDYAEEKPRRPYRGFWYWLMVGIAVSLPGGLIAVGIFLAWLYLSGVIG